MNPIPRRRLVRRLAMVAAAVGLALLAPALRAPSQEEEEEVSPPLASASLHRDTVDLVVGATRASAPAHAGASAELVTVHGRTDSATFVYDAEGGHWLEISRSTTP
jgi:hypothetical protein